MLAYFVLALIMLGLSLRVGKATKYQLNQPRMESTTAARIHTQEGYS